MLPGRKQISALPPSGPDMTRLLNCIPPLQEHVAFSASIPRIYQKQENTPHSEQYGADDIHCSSHSKEIRGFVRYLHHSGGREVIFELRYDSVRDWRSLRLARAFFSLNTWQVEPLGRNEARRQPCKTAQILDFV